MSLNIISGVRTRSSIVIALINKVQLWNYRFFKKAFRFGSKFPTTKSFKPNQINLINYIYNINSKINIYYN